MSSDRWIVSSHRFTRHTSFDAAQAEQKRLTEKTGKTYHLYRVKNGLRKSSSTDIIEKLSAALQAALPGLEHELEQREHGGNGEEFEGLKAVVAQCRAALDAAKPDTQSKEDVT